MLNLSCNLFYQFIQLPCINMQFIGNIDIGFVDALVIPVFDSKFRIEYFIGIFTQGFIGYLFRCWLFRY